MSFDLDQLQLKKAGNYKTVPFIYLQQLYEFEFAPITGEEVNEDGLYDQESIRSHWSKDGVDIYILYLRAIPIGFTVVNLTSMIDDSHNTKDIAEFFVMPSHRKNDIGKWMAHTIFRMYEGKWEVRQLPGLEGARTFWRKVIAEFSNNEFQEIEMDDSSWQGTLQRFRYDKAPENEKTTDNKYSCAT